MRSRWFIWNRYFENCGRACSFGYLIILLTDAYVNSILHCVLNHQEPSLTMAKTHHQYRFLIIWLSNVKFVNCQRRHQCRICSITSNVKYILANILIQNILNMKCRLWDRPQWKFGEKKKKLRHFIHCPKKRGEKIKQDTFMILARWQFGKIEWQKGRKRSRTEDIIIYRQRDKIKGNGAKTEQIVGH